MNSRLLGQLEWLILRLDIVTFNKGSRNEN